MPITLEPVLPHILPFVLVMTRLGGLFVFGPMFGSIAVPMNLKVLLVVTLSFCVYPLTPEVSFAWESIWMLAYLVASEALIGLLLGFGASLPLVAMQIGGLMMGQQLGLGFARVINPEIGEQSDIVGELLFLLSLAIFLVLNGHHALLAAVAGSFHNIPLGGYSMHAEAVDLLTGLLLSMFDLALKVCAPLLALVFLESVAMGFINRTVPQLNILSLGFPLRSLAGFSFLIGIIATQIQAFRDLLGEVITKLFLFVGM